MTVSDKMKEAVLTYAPLDKHVISHEYHTRNQVAQAVIDAAWTDFDPDDEFDTNKEYLWEALGELGHRYWFVSVPATMRALDRNILRHAAPQDLMHSNKG